MQIIVKPNTKNYNQYQEFTNILLLPLDNFSVGYNTYFTIEDIKKIDGFDIYVSMNKNIFNDDLEKVKEVLVELDKLNVKGVFFYDIALIALKKELKLKMDLIIDINHMMDNHNLMNYFYDLGVNIVKLPSELTIDEVEKIKQNTKAKLIFNYIGVEDVAFSKRKLVTNSNYLNNEKEEKNILIKEIVSGEEFIVNENNLGTSFIKNKVFNGSSALEKLVNINMDYILLNEDYIEHNLFIKTLEKLQRVLDNKDYSLYVKEMEKLLGDYTGFLYKDTIYKVKKDEKN